MTRSQEIERQIAQYEAKLNGLERERSQAVSDIEHGGREARRLEVLLELGEATADELVNTRGGIVKAGRRLEAANEQLELARRAHAELEGRLEGARAEDARGAKRAALAEYRDAATELLRLLTQVEEQRKRMEAAGPQYWREGFVGLSKASRITVESWPKQLEQDVKLAEARLGAFDESGK
jgi:chromosome segregation ATPase